MLRIRIRSDLVIFPHEADPDPTDNCCILGFLGINFLQIGSHTERKYDASTDATAVPGRYV
jgi:hypothetical protein